MNINTRHERGFEQLATVKKYRRSIRRHAKELVKCGMPERAKQWRERIRDW